MIWLSNVLLIVAVAAGLLLSGAFASGPIQMTVRIEARRAMNGGVPGVADETVSSGGGFSR